MSKAFTSEETEDVSVPGRHVVRSAPGQERPITPEGHRALIARRDAWIAERARESGERSKEIDHRLALIGATLESVRVVAPIAVDGTAHFGSLVTLRWDDGREQRVTLVGPDEAEGDRVSVAGPIGRALIGSKRGSVIEIERPRGTIEAEVIAVE